MSNDCLHLLRFCDTAQNFLALEDCAVVQGGGIGAIELEIGSRQHFLHSTFNTPEAAQHNSDLLVDDPLGIESLLGQRPAIALHNHRQLHQQSFAEAAGAWFADEEVRERHVVGNLGSKAFDEKAKAVFLATQYP